jgi:hypothetical protein
VPCIRFKCRECTVESKPSLPDCWDTIAGLAGAMQWTGMPCDLFVNLILGDGKPDSSGFEVGLL